MATRVRSRDRDTERRRGGRDTLPARNDARREARIHCYRAHRHRVGEALLRAALRALAATDAVATVNSILENKFGLTDVSLDQREATSNIMSVLRAEVMHVLADASVVPSGERRQLLARTIARMIPRRDNVLASPGQRAPESVRHDDLDRLIQRELRDAAGRGARPK